MHKIRMDIEQLIVKLKEGEEAAYKELVLTFSRRLMTVARLYCRKEEDAKDILQDAFVLVFRKVENFVGHEEAAFYSWMKRIVINLALSRSQKKYLKMEQSIETTVVSDTVNPAVISDLSHKEIMNLVFNLPDGYRQVFAMFAIEGYSHREIAEKLNIKESSSRSQYMRSRKLLQKQINNLFKVMTA